jgi:hypothetical protein
MKIAIAAAACLGYALLATAGGAAQHAAAKGGTAKPPPACAALAFRPLPAGTADGDQTAGLYKSRLARLELQGSVKGGVVETYRLLANGKGLAPVQALPPAAGDCAAAKKMPKPGGAATACTGERFTVVVAHAGDKRYALLYAQSGGAWTFCDAGGF